MKKCLLCEKEGKPSNGLSIFICVCNEHHVLLKELEIKNKKRYERIVRKIH